MAATTKTVLITGCSRGIGLGLVKEFLKNGFSVIATCRVPEKATELCEVLSKNGQRAPMTLDTSSISSVESCKSQIVQEYDRLDVLINNAGISNKNHPVSYKMKLPHTIFNFQYFTSNHRTTWQLTLN